MIEPFTYAIQARRNSDYRCQFTMTVSEECLDPIADITGWEPRMDVRAAPGAPGAALIGLSATPTANGSVITIIDGPAAQYEIFISKLDWPSIPAARNPSEAVTAYYDLIWTEPGGDADVYQQGSLILEPGVTV